MNDKDIKLKLLAKLMHEMDDSIMNTVKPKQIAKSMMLDKEDLDERDNMMDEDMDELMDKPLDEEDPTSISKTTITVSPSDKFYDDVDDSSEESDDYNSPLMRRLKRK